MEKLQTPAEIRKALRARAKKAAQSLPPNYLAIIVKFYPQFNTIEGGRLIDNVKRGKSTHKALTEIFEEIATGRLTMQGEMVSE